MTILTSYLYSNPSTLKPKDDAEYKDDMAQHDEFLHPHEANLLSNDFTILFPPLLLSHNPPNNWAMLEHWHLSLHFFLHPRSGMSEELNSIVMVIREWFSNNNKNKHESVCVVVCTASTQELRETWKRNVDETSGDSPAPLRSEIRPLRDFNSPGGKRPSVFRRI